MRVGESEGGRCWKGDESERGGRGRGGMSVFAGACLCKYVLIDGPRYESSCSHSEALKMIDLESDDGLNRLRGTVTPLPINISNATGAGGRRPRAKRK